jgi:hypothetical protein
MEPLLPKRLLTLYIGAGTRRELVRFLGRRFDSFTIWSAQGVFRGKAERTWVVKVGTHKPERVIAATVALRETFDQEGIGIEFESRYYCVTATDRASGLLKPRTRHRATSRAA